jgi:hypothetical protein
MFVEQNQSVIGETNSKHTPMMQRRIPAMRNAAQE